MLAGFENAVVTPQTWEVSVMVETGKDRERGTI